VSILTLYRPNFCCACGAKIARLRWYLWTSRKFCIACAPQFRKEHCVQSAVTLLGLLIVGIMVGRAIRPSPPPLIIQRNVVAATGAGTPPATQLTPEEDVYICGARTKKGTPCSRRVHGAIRCWQHKGLSAMLPLEKLKIRE
jgi:hypothetical protein